MSPRVVTALIALSEESLESVAGGRRHDFTTDPPIELPLEPIYPVPIGPIVICPVEPPIEYA